MTPAPWSTGQVQHRPASRGGGSACSNLRRSGAMDGSSVTIAAQHRPNWRGSTGKHPADSKKNVCKPCAKVMWCSGRITDDTGSGCMICWDPTPNLTMRRPVVCLEEKSKHYWSKPVVRLGVSRAITKKRLRVSRPEHGNLFVAVEPQAGHREVRDPAADQARFCEFGSISTGVYAGAHHPPLVLDNLNTTSRILRGSKG